MSNIICRIPEDFCLVTTMGRVSMGQLVVRQKLSFASERRGMCYFFRVFQLHENQFQPGGFRKVWKNGRWSWIDHRLFGRRSRHHRSGHQVKKVFAVSGRLFILRLVQMHNCSMYISISHLGSGYSFGMTCHDHCFQPKSDTLSKMSSNLDQNH